MLKHNSIIVMLLSCKPSSYFRAVRFVSFSLHCKWRKRLWITCSQLGLARHSSQWRLSTPTYNESKFVVCFSSLSLPFLLYGYSLLTPHLTVRAGTTTQRKTLYCCKGWWTPCIVIFYILTGKMFLQKERLLKSIITRLTWNPTQ